VVLPFLLIAENDNNVLFFSHLQAISKQMGIMEQMQQALAMLVGLDADLWEIILLSVRVSGTATLLALLLGLPLGALLATRSFAGRNLVIILVNSLLALPPVVAGLIIYLLLSRSGPFGWLDLLYSPAAMIIAQFILILPIAAALSRQVFEQMMAEYAPLLASLRCSTSQRIMLLLRDGRLALITVVLACFGRAIAEVGAVIIVGGNINHVSRVLTTSIALETSRGELALALALGIVLLVIALLVNLAGQLIRYLLQRSAADV
jgi:tungstate transport system permease protein